MNDLNHSVTLTLTANDYVAAKKLFILRYLTSRWLIIFWLGFLTLLFAMLFLPALQMHASFAPIVYIGFAVVITVPFFQYFIGAAIFARKTYAAQRTLQHPMTVSWSAAGFRSIAQQDDWNIAWSDYLKWAEDHKVILPYQGPRVFNLLPKRVLTTSQIADIRQVLAANVERA